MIITLNILPPEKRRYVRLSQFYVMIKNLIITILLIIIVTAIVLLLTKMSLQNHFNAVVDQTTLTSRVSKLFNQDIKNFNELLSNVETMQTGYIQWSLFIQRLANITPDGISYTNLRFSHEKDGDKLIITGVAATRDQLLTFRKNLEDSQLLSNVDMPLESLLKREDIRFDIKADIQLKNLVDTDVN